MPKEILCKNLDETSLLAKKFAEIVGKTGAFVCLFGDIGSGKTAFARFVAEHLDVKEKVTSPSFVILNEYHTGTIPIFHFDLYRLENEGVKTILDELTEYSGDKAVTLVEWAEFSQGEIPLDRIEVKIDYVDKTERKFTFDAFGEKSSNILERFEV